MRRMLLVFGRDFREIRRTAAFRILLAVAAAITVAAATGISIVLRRQPWTAFPEARPALELIVGLVVYFLPLFVIIAFSWAFGSLLITEEKVNGTVECLLATPLGPKALWMGKGLAIFLPAYAVSVIASLIVALAVNLVAIAPAARTFVLPAAGLVTGLLTNPLLFFALLSFVILFSLAGNPEIAIAPFILVAFGLMMGIPVGLGTGAVDIAGWGFGLWYIAGTFVVWAIVLFLTRLLDKEHIVLSAKGN